MSMEFLEEYSGTLPNLPRSYGRVCCICGRCKTYLRDGTTPVWAKYKDENGKWTGEWTCHSCQGKRKRSKEIRCRLCGSDKTRISNGEPLWIKDLDIYKKFTGKYLCYKCAYEDNRPTCGHTNRIYKVYNNGIWTGKRRCKTCKVVYTEQEIKPVTK